MAGFAALGLPLAVPHLRGRKANGGIGTGCCQQLSVSSLCKSGALLNVMIQECSFCSGICQLAESTAGV